MKSFRAFLLVLFSLYSLSGCASTELASSLFKQRRPQYKVGGPYVVDGKLYYPTEVASYVEEGDASWYGPGFHGRDTANGEQFDTDEMTAAHRTLPMPSVARVTNLQNGKSVFVRINDRGPFKRGRIIDVSKSAAQELDFHGQGTTRVRVEFMPEESRLVAEAAKQGQTLSLADVLARTGGGSYAANTGVEPAPTAPIEVANLDGAQQGGSYQPAAYLPPVEPQKAGVLRAPVNYHYTQVPKGKLAKAGKAPVYIQVGAYATKQHAMAVGKKLAKLGSVKTDTVMRNGVKLYRVRLAAPNSAAAEKMMGRAADMGYGGARVMQ